MPYIYILHFKRPLCHAQHYTGAATILKRRIDRHAAGQGAALTAAIVEEGIGWELGGVYEVTEGNLFEAEKRAKAKKNGRTLCEICSPKGTARVRGTRAISRHLFSIPPLEPR